MAEGVSTTSNSSGALANNGPVPHEPTVLYGAPAVSNPNLALSPSGNFGNFNQNYEVCEVIGKYVAF